MRASDWASAAAYTNALLLSVPDLFTQALSPHRLSYTKTIIQEQSEKSRKAGRKNTKTSFIAQMEIWILYSTVAAIASFYVASFISRYLKKL